MKHRIAAASLLLCLLSLARSGPCQTERRQSFAALYRTEIAQAAAHLKWKGPALSDETLLAVAASGLSWQPAWQSTALVRRDRKSVSFTDADSRRTAFADLQRSGDDRLAVPFALSVVLDPGGSDSPAWRNAFDYLSGFGDDFDRVLMGIEQAPEQLPLLPSLSYAAADVLVWRASPRLLPFLFTMADSSDRYLRSRGVAAIGVAAFSRSQSQGQVTGVSVPLRAASISANQQGMIGEALRRAAEDKNCRVRAAAALALGLAGDESDLPALERLSRDGAYLALPVGDRNTRRIAYPVRIEAVRALARFGRTAPEPPGGVLSGKALKQAMRGGHDVTRDTSDIRKDRRSLVRFCDGQW